MIDQQHHSKQRHLKIRVSKNRTTYCKTAQNTRCVTHVRHCEPRTAYIIPGICHSQGVAAYSTRTYALSESCAWQAPADCTCIASYRIYVIQSSRTTHQLTECRLWACINMLGRTHCLPTRSLAYPETPFEHHLHQRFSTTSLPRNIRQHVQHPRQLRCLAFDRTGQTGRLRRRFSSN
jgi:hypothetical protein